MLWLVILLVVTNLATLGTLLFFLYGPEQHPGPDEQLAGALDRTAPRAAAGGTRRVITIEILNPIELAATRGRLVGMAGSLAPGLTRRIVYDQAVRNMKRQLAEEHVVADVRVHTFRAVPQKVTPTAPPIPAVDESIPYGIDASAPVDLVKADPAQQDGQLPA